MEALQGLMQFVSSRRIYRGEQILRRRQQKRQYFRNNFTAFVLNLVAIISTRSKCQMSVNFLEIEFQVQNGKWKFAVLSLFPSYQKSLRTRADLSALLRTVEQRACYVRTNEAIVRTQLMEQNGCETQTLLLYVFVDLKRHNVRQHSQHFYCIHQ